MELEKTYNPKDKEAGIYKRWEEAHVFEPSQDGEPFSIIMPPPNANGSLHAGHAVGYTLEDIITRFMRMQGKSTLWLPGTDHAGIETQYVYERDVLAKTGKTRFDLGPDKFYSEVMKFTKAAQGKILTQMRQMGWGADWSKLKFTLDEDVVTIVLDTFKRLHKDGHVYRGERIVNWCSWCGAAFSDLELSHPEQKDVLYTLDYGPIKIATTRPETIFADTAVAVNPDDPRYKSLVGKTAIVPLIDKKVPILADTAVDPKFGSGALKVTPAHDGNDFEIGTRNNLEKISVINHSAELINVPSEFAGLSVKEARPKVVEALKTAGKVAKEEQVTHSIATHERCGTQIEPLLSKQWFLRVAELNKPVIKAIEKDEIKFHPARFKKIALDWLKNEHDWNISRQIWWGIRIPVYYKISDDKKKKPYIIAASEAEAKKYYGAGNYRAETDTFDTWFSSGQWPYATLKATGTFNKFFPTTLMATAREILHKWVTRMIMFSLYQTGEVPFKDVYLWGIVTDAHGQKMSKSKGNVIDPLDMSNKYGTDALRLAGAISNTPGTDSPLSEDQIRAMRNFCNKLWNVSRFCLAALAKHRPEGEPKPSTIADEWMLTQLSYATEKITNNLSNYRLNEAASQLYHLLWDDFADWYVEVSKVNLNPEVLWYGLKTILQLAHPFVPFITEAIWQNVNSRELLANARWPQVNEKYERGASQFNRLISLVSEMRNIAQEMGLSGVGLFYNDSKLITEHAAVIKKLTGVAEVTEVEVGRGLPLVASKDNAWLGVDTETVAAYGENLQKKINQTESYINTIKKKLANRQFKKHAPKQVVKDAKIRLKSAEEQLEFMQTQLERFTKAS